MTRNMEYYKLLAIQQARLSYRMTELNRESMDRFVTETTARKGDADVHTSSECDHD